ncbi:nucleotide 5'-monophosphate nucleosidase PpnN [Agarivorans sp. TSD2052]|uniref:nucleotide 5'-monophosphate nucleosidase PpnN n=1 Tax=Agarivorans sp. TSD2052 TaxID=2937286 RepID=UPI00200D5A72|nr:nucleotide 5'-monophosphate nucleosidase PpnN [Agarivorans sp. TSD2052]UPW17168.1 nucleotide 5'-monophosphate nucleosidase PpnN [Agarivorans sp. TSD2052]
MITHINPVGSMNLLSQLEVDQLTLSASKDIYLLYRNCSLAVLNSGSKTDSSREMLERYQSFEINVLSRERGVKLELANAPEEAFVDGAIIRGIQEHLFSVLRDILYVSNQLKKQSNLDLSQSSHITNLVFSMLRNARVIHPKAEPNLVVCWGGHSINEVEYQYTREVGSQLGLRELNICTGCGPGAMEGPMKGAAVGHAKQRVNDGRYIGLTEPSIIAAEPPNPIVNELVILPDIEKRLEAFVRTGHAIVIFPGGAGTAEELLYILGIMLHPENARQPLPIVLTGPKSSEEYFRSIDRFIGETLGPEAQQRYQIIIDDAAAAAQVIKQMMPKVKDYRRAIGDAYSFNWSLKIDSDFQQPFLPLHENVKTLNLHFDQPPQQLAANLRRAFSAIVSGNVKDEGIKEIEQHGPFIIDGDPKIMKMMDKLLQDFVSQHRMKLPGSHYEPCYKISQS